MSDRTDTSNPEDAFVLREGETHQAYLGDGVYVAFDGYHIWLRTQERDEIALDPYLVERLITYVDDMARERRKVAAS
jgi:hypothetical protein